MAKSAPSDSRKIGILGGSFNPPHEGHLKISLHALDLLGLDEIWWLVSPQNPLKSSEDTLEFAERIELAKNLTCKHANIKISDFEQKHSCKYTYDSISALKTKYPDHKFVWLMGADNLAGFPKWYRWQDLIKLLPIAVFARAEYYTEVLEKEEYKALRKYIVNMAEKLDFSSKNPPAILLLNTPKYDISSTALRQKNK